MLIWKYKMMHDWPKKSVLDNKKIRSSPEVKTDRQQFIKKKNIKKKNIQTNRYKFHLINSF